MRPPTFRGPRAVACVALAMASIALLPVSTAEASAPPAPPGCAATKTTLSNTTTTAISASGTPTVTSEIPVLAGAFLADIDVFTDIDHARAKDLDMALTSPSGRIVTLATDDGGNNANVFAGTTWDDDADPGGQVPYTSNNGLAEDHAYQDNVVATPLAPEEALGAFVGVNPNGNWVLTISDDTANNGGKLNKWSITLTTYPSAPAMSGASAFGNGTDVTTVSGAAVKSKIPLAGLGPYLGRISVSTSLDHSHSQDIDMTVRSPQGTVVTLVSDHGSGSDSFAATEWADNLNSGGPVPYTNNNGLATDRLYVANTPAGDLVPEEALAAFIGENPNGTWTLAISDDKAGDEGKLTDWGIDLETSAAIACPVSPCQGEGVTIAGTSASETLTGTSGNDVISGGGGSDIIRGLDGNDTICGGGGADTLKGGGDDDAMDGGPGADTFLGGAGADTADYSIRSFTVAVTLDDAANDGSGGEGDNVRADVENVIGGAGNDSVSGSASANTLTGGAGDDVLKGGAGSDTLNGNTGDDTLKPGTGIDTLNGGADTDTATYAERTKSVSVTIDAMADDGEAGENDFVKTDVENVTGGSGADNLTGSSSDNTLSGGPGADVLAGLAGNDLLNGDGGSDVLDGGSGDLDTTNGGNGTDSCTNGEFGSSCES